MKMAQQLDAPLDCAPAKGTWLLTFKARLRRRESQDIVLGGSLIMLLSTTLVSGVNFFYNVAMARMMGPSEFGHVTAAVTLLMLASAVTLSFQIVCAKLIAQHDLPGAKAGIYKSMARRAWVVSLALGLVLFAGQGPIAAFLRLPDPWILGVLAIGIAAYAPLGVHRGAMQGTCSFGRLGSNFIVEATARFLIAVVLVGAGYGVLGAVGAISASVIVACVLPLVPKQLQVQPLPGIRPSMHEAFQAMIFFVGQVIINNVDILMVKHFFPPEQAGLYAAVALIGRVLYLAAWSIVSAMFPVSAASKEHAEQQQVVFLPMVLVLGVVVVFVLTVSFLPQAIMHGVFGAKFAEGGPLLALYAAATGLYALSVVMMAYEMSRRKASTAWLQLIFSGGVVLAISIFHHDLRQVIVVQIVLMALMLLLVSLGFARRRNRLLAEVAAA